jgi:hypothetical protein
MRARTIIAAAIGLLSTTVPLVPSSAAPASAPKAASTWEVAYTSGNQRDYDYFTDIQAFGNGHAWASGFYQVEHPGKATVEYPNIRRFDGTSWKSVTFPWTRANSPMKKMLAISDANVWLFGGTTKSPQALHWNGKTWKTVKIAYPITEAIALSANDLWGFGQASDHKHGFAAHYNGHSWKRYTLTAAPQRVSAGASTNVAVYFTHDNGKDALQRWDGHSWKTIALPSLSANSTVDDVATEGSGTVYLLGRLESEGLAVLKWTKTGWTQTTHPTDGGGDLYAGAADGNGGVWAWNGQYGPESDFSRPRLIHIQGDVWTEVPIPAPAGWGFFTLYKMARVPGSDRLFAVGSTRISPDSPVDDINAVVYAYR